MKWILYNVLFAIAYFAMLPHFLWRMKRRGGYRDRFADRFGRYPRDVAAALAGMHGKAIWVHAVSVGEVGVAGQLMRALREKDPSLRFVLSTTSSTGWAQARRTAGPDDVAIYYPVDFPRCVRRALDAVRPRAVVLAESEIWPNFIRAARRRGIPLFLANARVSDRSAPRYKALRWFFGEIFRSFSRIYAQSRTDAERLEAAGADGAAIEVAGSFKFDGARRDPAKEKEVRAWLGSGGPLLLGGSTWPGEDEVLLRIYASLRGETPGLKLAIVPRHFEKADAVEANIRAAGFECIRRSRGDAAPEDGAAGPGAVFLADTTGELSGFYGCADVAFVGKSLCAHGSQNMIEPCLCGAATVVGPYTENFRPVMSELLAAGAIVQAGDEAGVARETARLLKDADARRALGRRAAQAVESLRGASGRCAASMLAIMGGGATA